MLMVPRILGSKSFLRPAPRYPLVQHLAAPLAGVPRLCHSENTNEAIRPVRQRQSPALSMAKVRVRVFRCLKLLSCFGGRRPVRGHEKGYMRC
jgi:hypothetical protein